MPTEAINSYPHPQQQGQYPHTSHKNLYSQSFPHSAQVSCAAGSRLIKIQYPRLAQAYALPEIKAYLFAA